MIADNIVGELAVLDLPSLGPYRQYSDWELAKAGEESCFIKAPISEEYTELFSKIPFTNRWYLDDGKLYLQGHTLPSRTIQGLQWFSLASFLPLSPVLPVSNEDYFSHLSIELEPAFTESESRAMICSYQEFKRWVETASELRMNPLKYAVSSDERVFILGTPLPPIYGVSYYQEGAIFLPAGKQLPENIHFQLIESSLNLTRKQIAIFSGVEFDVIDSECLLPVSRSGVRTVNVI